MDILSRITQLRTERDWTIYKLASMSGLAYKTIYKWYNGESVPTLKAIEAIAEAFGITLSELFAEDDNAVVDNDFKELYKVWKTLTESQQQAVMTVIKSYKND